MTTIADVTTSRGVDWWSVWTFLAPLLAGAGQRPPVVGSLAWQQLPDDDPLKMAAVYQAAAERALSHETTQAALAEASQDVSAAYDWSAIAAARRRHQTGRLSAAYIPRRAAS